MLLRSALAGLAATLLLPAAPAFAAHYRVIHNFCEVGACLDGTSPEDQQLLVDAEGSLYGVTAEGGTNDGGVVFKPPKRAHHRYGPLKILYDFCQLADCADGDHPGSSLIMDTEGNLYGTTTGGRNAQDHGNVFKLIKRSAKPWRLKVLHTFCSSAQCADGERPAAGLTYAGQSSGALYDGTSTLYGTTALGGQPGNGLGTVFKLEPGLHKTWNQTVLYAFCPGGNELNCPDGRTPSGNLFLDGSGNLIGTTPFGGSTGHGTVFQVNASTGSETVLHSFCLEASCADGDFPVGALVPDGLGDLYGMTVRGGTFASLAGVVFKLTPSGTASPYEVTYKFCTPPSCIRGTIPQSGLAMDAAGNLFGTTFGGGTSDAGVVFKLTDGGSTLHKLHDFCSEADCADGSRGLAAPAITPDGRIVGTTIEGGTHNSGVIFEVVP